MNINTIQINQKIHHALDDLGFTDLTPIQEKCIPHVLEGKDIFGQSSTGSGKTAAFGIPILEKLTPGNGIKALILTPTRELCVQVTSAIRSFSKYLPFRITSVYGGVGINPQIQNLRTADIVVGTPGRILDHLERNTINLHNVRYFVLDEADRMLDMGFIDAVEDIMRHLPRERQTLLFSATLPSAVMHLVKRHLREPITVKSELYVAKNMLHQVYYDLPSHDKFSLLLHLLKEHPKGMSLIFCATRREVGLLTDNLKAQGTHAMAIHGGLTQNKRTDAIEALKKEHITILVATDVAARGLDLRNVTHVYNYDVPKTSDEYIHRIGRTARAGMEGDAITLLCDRDYENFGRVISDRTLEIKKAVVPQFTRVRFVRMQHERSHRPFGHRDHERRSYQQHYQRR